MTITVFSQTYITNPLVTTTTWTEDPNPPNNNGSPYFIQTDIAIPSGNILTIEPGVVVIFEYDQNTQVGYKLNVDGQVTAIGTTNKSITFNADDQNIGWSGIEIVNNTNNNEFEYCIFEYIDKTGSGAIYLENTSSTSFSNCIFRHNDVSSSGGGIYSLSSLVKINDCQFIYNEADDYGGAIAIDNPDQLSSIIGCWIENNDSYYGGGISLRNANSDIHISTNIIQSNNATSGGGFYLENNICTSDPLLVSNQIQSNNAILYGGGLYLSASEIVEISSNFFYMNEAPDGGGSYISNSEITNFLWNRFDNNTAYNNGGAVYLNESYVRVKLSKIINNQAGNDGGGVYITGMHGSGYNYFINCSISENQATTNGGGIYTNVYFYSYSNTIAYNTATNGQGGGIYNQFSNASVVNTILWGNTAPVNPQAYPTPDGSIGYSYCCCPTITNCPTCTTQGPDFVGIGNYNLAYNSSCYNAGNNNTYHETQDLDGRSRVLHTDIDIGAYEDPKKQHNCQTQINANDTWTDHNSEGIDYVVNCDMEVLQGNTLTIKPGTEIAFNGNYKLLVNGAINAGANGSANNMVVFDATPGNTWKGIHFAQNAPASTLNYCEVTNVNKPNTGNCYQNDPDYCGAIYIESTSEITISHSEVHDNEVCSDGGGIYIANSSPKIEYSKIYSNNSGNDGGGIYITSGTPEIYNNFIENNQCNNNGGGIFTASTNTPKIYNNLLDNNIADQNGGGVYMDEISATNIYNCTVADNIANNGSGGGLYHADNSNANSINNIIWDNTANNSNYHHVYINYSTPSYSNCCSDYTIPVVSCTNCNTQDPEFIGGGDYDLNSYTSSCFNEGDKSISTLATDLNGNTRIVDAYKIDIGAYELQTSILGLNCDPANPTDVSGNWSDQNDHGIDYVIVCDIEVPSGNSLNISGGTNITFTGSYRMDIIGDLSAQGATFTCNNQNGWLGINFGSSSSNYGGTSSLTSCVVENVNKTGNPGTGKDDNTVSGALFIYPNSNAEVTINGCTVKDNKVPAYGGGIMCYNCTDDIEIKHSIIQDNDADIGGGGIAVCNQSIPEIHHNTINLNSSNNGGGIFIEDDCQPIPDHEFSIFHNFIKNNTAVNNGGGVYIYDYCEPMFYNNVVHHNEADNGGGIYIGDNSAPKLYSCTIADNEAKGTNAGGVYFESNCNNTEFRNTIVWWNKPDNPNPTDVLFGGASPDAQDNYYLYCDIRNFTNLPNNANLNADPQFVNHSSADYRVSRINGSPCHDVGYNVWYQSQLSTSDIRGLSRIVDCHTSLNYIDMGAYEYEGSGDCYKSQQQGLYKLAENDTLIDISFDLMVYPNPAREWFTIQYLSEIEEYACLNIYNTIGKTCLKKDIQLKEGINSIKLEKGSLKKGIYFVRINSNTRKSETVKLILK